MTTKYETINEKYARQKERREMLLKTENFAKYDNDYSDRILLSAKEAKQLGIISPNFADKFSKMFNDKTK